MKKATENSKKERGKEDKFPKKVHLKNKKKIMTYPIIGISQ